MITNYAKNKILMGPATTLHGTKLTAIL